MQDGKEAGCGKCAEERAVREEERAADSYEKAPAQVGAFFGGGDISEQPSGIFKSEPL